MARSEDKSSLVKNKSPTSCSGVIAAENLQIEADISKDTSNCCHGRSKFGYILLSIAIVALVLGLSLGLSNKSQSSNSTGNIVSDDDNKGGFDDTIFEDPFTYKIWRTGNPYDVVTKSQPGALIIGGGEDPYEGFAWQIGLANGGDYVVLRAFGADGYNDWIMNISINEGIPLNSVTTILFHARNASFEPEVLDIISGAEAIFFAGGDQSYYLNYWVNTSVQSIINDNLTHVSVGGTSAGCAILGNWIYSCEDGCSVTSNRALANPYYECMASTNFASAFLNIPFMTEIMTDTHFVTRNRMGRLVAFLAREVQDFNPPGTVIRGLGMDEQTFAKLNITTGQVEFGGAGTGYLCTPTELPEICERDVPLTFTMLNCTRFSGPDKDTFSFATFQGLGGVNYNSSVVDGNFTNCAYGPNFGPYDVEGLC